MQRLNISEGNTYLLAAAVALVILSTHFLVTHSLFTLHSQCGALKYFSGNTTPHLNTATGQAWPGTYASSSSVATDLDQGAVAVARLVAAYHLNPTATTDHLINTEYTDPVLIEALLDAYATTKNQKLKRIYGLLIANLNEAALQEVVFFYALNAQKMAQAPHDRATRTATATTTAQPHSIEPSGPTKPGIYQPKAPSRIKSTLYSILENRQPDSELVTKVKTTLIRFFDVPEIELSM